MDHLAEIKRFHSEILEPHIGKPVGCSANDVDELAQRLGHPLPEAYRQYLLWMGRDKKGIFQGCDWFIDDVISNTEYLPELLAHNHIEHNLPVHNLAFFSHQGYMAAWFELPKNSDDPPCYFFSEGGRLDPDKPANPPTIFGTFTSVLFTDMKGMASSRHEAEMIDKGYLPPD